MSWINVNALVSVRFSLWQFMYIILFSSPCPLAAPTLIIPALIFDIDSWSPAVVGAWQEGCVSTVYHGGYHRLVHRTILIVAFIGGSVALIY
jgi:hypothetical protein